MLGSQDTSHTAIGGVGPLREQVYVAMRQDLMSGVFDPTARLREERLGEIYGVSRTPVREALARLESDGLVQRQDTGMYPYRPRFDDLAGLYELRITLELRGITRNVEPAPDAEPPVHDHDVLGPVVDHWRALRTAMPAPDAGFVAQDEQFHVALLLSSGNAALADALTAVNARIRPVRMFDYLTADRIAATIDEHIQVGELVLAGELAQADLALRAHIDESRRVVISRAAEALSMSRIALSVRD